MLIKKPQIHIVSREVALPTGELVRAFFAVIETTDASGQLVREIKFLGTKPIAADVQTDDSVADILMLAGPKSESYWSELFIPSYFEAVSPFYTLDFLVSQLARAPSVK